MSEPWEDFDQGATTASAPSPDEGPWNDFSDKLTVEPNPYEKAKLKYPETRGVFDNSDDLLRAVVNDPKSIPKIAAGLGMSPFDLAGKIVNAAAQDAGAVIGANPEGFGNVEQVLSQTPVDTTPLPSEKTLADISKEHPIIATTGKVASGLAQTAPMMAAGLPGGALGRLISLGFSADMIAGGNEAAKQLGEEMGKNPEDRDADKVTSAVSSLIQSGAFAPLAGAHGLKPGVTGELALQLLKDPKVYPMEKPSAPVVETVNQNPWDDFKQAEPVVAKNAQTETKPTETETVPPVSETKTPDPNWRVTVQPDEEISPGNVMPGYVQIDDVTGGQNKWSSSPETLAKQGITVPDFSKLPKGQYTFAEAEQLLEKQKSSPPPDQPITAPTPPPAEPEAPTEQAPAGGEPETESQTEQPSTLDPEIISLIQDYNKSPGAKSAAMRKMAADRGIPTKAMQEQVEAHVVRLADADARLQNMAPDDKFLEMVRLYDRQPRFTGRTSTSVGDQAYSTPVPLAYALNHAIGEGKDAYEPTAGNGALLIGDDLANSHANEKNSARANELRANGTKTVTENDATAFQPGLKRFSRVKTNPPFGAIDNVNYHGYGIKRLEHLISLKALESMKDDGAGYMILGAGLHSSETGKGAQRVFENYLYQHYNVVGNFEVAGDLYSHQGASFPVRVLVVNGRRGEPLPMGEYSPKSVERFQNWSDVWNETKRIKNEIDAQREGLRPSGTPGIPARPEGGGTPAENEGRAPVEARPPVAPAGRRGNTGGNRRGKQPVGEQPSEGGTPEPTGRPASEPENRPRAANATGGLGEPTARMEGGNEPRPISPADAGERIEGGGGGVEPGIVSTPDSLTDELKKTNVNDLLDEAEESVRPELANDESVGAEAARRALKQGVAGVDEAFKGLGKLFGGGKNLGTGPMFDEKTFAEAKPHFEAAWKQFSAAGKSLKQYAQFILKNFGAEVRPYIQKFLEDKQAEPTAPEPKAPPKVQATEYQVPYEPRSHAPAFGTLIPKSIAGGVHAYMDSLKERVGPIDEFVSKELDMPLAQLRKVMSAEQVDGVAMAIDQIKNDGATIIGDQTGIGKGRQAAAVIRYALKSGAIPIFVTKDGKLFSDMFGDLADIYDVDGPRSMATTVRPLIFGNAQNAKIVDTAGTKIHSVLSKSAQEEAINNILNEGMDKSGFNAVFSTYDQLNARNYRQKFLEKLAADNPVIIVMDEAHLAAGDSESSMSAAFFTGGTVKKGSGSEIKKITVPGLLNASGSKSQRGGGVLYLSATYAKRPENMPVYFRTSLRKAADSFKAIVSAMEKGGVALQQAVSEALAQAGQYLRREREFTGVSYDMDRVSVENEQELIDHVDQVTDVLQQIVEFSKEVRESQEGSTAMSEDQMSMTDFASVVHNQIGQLLLAAKADAVVAKAIKAVKDGEKPVVALMNTMESFLDQYVEEKGIKGGEAFQLRWNELLKYALSRTLRYSEELPNGDTVIHHVNPDDIGLGDLYRSIEETANGIESKFPVSPIDYIIQKLDKAGIKMAELTGRTSGIKYTDFDTGTGHYFNFQKANKNKIVNGFNNGDYHGMLLNASGSTGLSAHASAKFKDQKPRRMLIAQPAADINTFVQTLGRIFRTGLVMTGKNEKGEPYGAAYSHLVLPLQAELRPAAMAARKMKSLNANTTAEADNAIKIESEDFMNRYGDAIVADYLDQDPFLQDKLDIHIDHKDDGTPKVERDLARKFTGRMARMPDDWQKKAYQEIIPAYRQLIEQLKANGEYDLEIVTHDDWDASRTSDAELAPGTDEGNIFTASVRMQNWDMSDRRRVPSGADMVKEAQKNLGSPERTRAEFDTFTTEATARLANKAASYQKIFDDPNSTPVEKHNAEKNLKIQAELLKRWEEKTVPAISEIVKLAGDMVTLTNKKTGDTYDAMLTDVRYPKGNRVAPSAFQFKFAVDAPGGVIHITGSQFGEDGWSIDRSWKKPDDFAGGIKEARYPRYVVTGNPIKAYSATGGRGKMVRFKSREGNTITGLLMPRNWGPNNLANDPRLDLINGSATAHYLKNNTTQWNPEPVESGGVVSISRNRTGSNSYTVKTGAARRTGGNIYLDPKLLRITGDFTKVGNRMEATIDESDLAKAADAIREITKAPFRPSGKVEELQPKVNESNNQAKRKGGFIGMGAAVPEEFEQSQNTPTATKNATVERERAARGLPPAMQPARREFGRVWDEAMAAIDQDPAIQDNLIEELGANPRAVTDFENALLLHRQIDLQNQYGKLTREMADAFEDAKDFPNRMDDVNELRPRVEAIRDQLFNLYEINKKVGTETGRGLNARKMMAYEDYTLAQMEVDARSANGGKPLTAEELEQVKALHEKIDRLRKEFDNYTEKTQARISELEAEQALNEIKAKTEPPIEPHIRTLAEKIMSTLEKEGNAARERIKARRGRLMTGLDPVDLADHAIVGAELLAKAGFKTAEWTKAMLKEFGDYVKPHLDQILAASQKRIDGKMAPQNAPKVKRAISKKIAPSPKEAIQEKIRSRVENGRKDEVSGYVRKLARYYVDEGITERNALIDAVHSDLMDIDPIISRRDTMDAISGYGEFKQLSKDEVSKQLRDLRGQMQQVAKLEDMEAGNPPLKTGLERRIPSQEESRLIKLVNEAKQKFQIPITDPNTQLKSSLDTLKARMQARIDEYERRLREGDFEKREKRVIQMDKAANELHFKLTKAQREWHEALMKKKLASRNILQKVLGGTAEAVNTMRAVMTSMDLSAVLRQGGFVAFAHPIRAAKAFPAMFRALRSESAQHAVNQEIVSRPNYPMYVRSKLYLSEHGQKLSQMEEAYMSRWADKIPLVAASQRAYVTFLNRLRADSFDAMAKTLTRDGELTQTEANAISNFVNVATGRGSLGMKENALVGLNTVFFAPRYVASRFQLLGLTPLYRGNARTRMLIGQEYARFLIGASIVYGLASLAGAQIEQDPRSSDFGKLRFGNTRIDPLFGLLQNTVFLTRFLSGETKKQTGEIAPAKSSDITINFLRNKLAPTIGLIFDMRDLLTGQKPPAGHGQTIPQTLGNVVFPLGLQDIYQAMQVQSVPVGTAMAILSLFGMGLQTQTPKPTKLSQ